MLVSAIRLNWYSGGQTGVCGLLARGINCRIITTHGAKRSVTACRWGPGFPLMGPRSFDHLKWTAQQQRAIKVIHVAMASEYKNTFVENPASLLTILPRVLDSAYLRCLTWQELTT